MVATARRAGFACGQRVKLLIGYLAWVEQSVGGNARPLTARGDLQCRFLLPGEPLTFVRHRDDLPGGCVVRDGKGVTYKCPVGYLEGGE
jgi:hypothetical protein